MSAELGLYDNDYDDDGCVMMLSIACHWLHLARSVVAYVRVIQLVCVVVGSVSVAHINGLPISFTLGFHCRFRIVRRAAESRRLTLIPRLLRPSRGRNPSSQYRGFFCLSLSVVGAFCHLVRAVATARRFCRYGCRLSRRLLVNPVILFHVTMSQSTRTTNTCRPAMDAGILKPVSLLHPRYCNETFLM